MPSLRRTRSAAVLLSALALVGAAAACSDDDPSTEPTTTTAAADGDQTTSTASDDVTTTTSPAAVDLVLRGDGLGAADFGGSPEPAVRALTEILGAPTKDTGWKPSFGSYGTCPGERIRGVEWDSLVLLFTDGETDQGSGEHFFSWRITGAPPAVGTASGFGYHATAADAEELYPGKVDRVPAEEPFPALLRIDAEGGQITAFLDEDDVVTNLEAGTPCGE